MGKNVKAIIERTIMLQGPLSAHALSTDVGVSRQYVHRVLAELVRSGSIIKTGTPPRVLYSANPVYTPTQTDNQHVPQHTFTVSKRQRLSRNKQKAFVLWFTGLSGAGKSTLANAVEQRLFDMKKHTYVLDSTSVRRGLNRDLTFSAKDRAENIRRIGETTKLFLDAGVITLAAFISPYTADRNMARSLLEEGEFIEVFVSCPLDVCEKRDINGLYKKARSGQIKEFTGIDAPYEQPENPEIIIETDKLSVDDSVSHIIQYLRDNNYVDV